jgi:hypothetical protein
MSTRSAPAAQAALTAELEQILGLERVIRAAQAEQFRRIEAARVLAAEVEGVTDASSPVEREFATRSFISELATTLVVHEASAGRLLAEAGHLTGPRVATLAALTSGEISIAQMRIVLDLTQALPHEKAAELERAALEMAPTKTNAACRRRLHRLRERLHPQPLAERRARVVEQRRVALDIAPDGMAWLSLFLEAERAVAIVERLDTLAEKRDETVPDPRTHAQRSADIAGDLLLAGSLDADERAGLSGTGRVAAHITVTVPVLSLLGVTDEPAELDGYGPIDADTARRLAAHAPSLERVLVHPETGAYLSYGRNRYRAPADLAGYLRIRDGRCRFPGCARRAGRCDVDHTIARARNGVTADFNLAHLCRKHHRLKHHTGWMMTHEAGGVIRWTSPAGHVLRTSPERPFTPVAVGSPLAKVPPDPPVTDVASERFLVEDPPWAHLPPAADAA